MRKPRIRSSVPFALLFAVAACAASEHAPAPANITAAVPGTAATTAAHPSQPSSPQPGDDWPENAPSPEQVLYDQPRLLESTLARLAPRAPGKVNLYAIAFAGDGSENVFRNEAEYFRNLFEQRFGAKGHVVVLENNPATLESQPLATWTNLEDTLDAMAGKMDPAQDILLLYFTTHGSGDHTLLVDMGPLPLDQIGAADLPGILAGHPFRYKVVIVNACYSGGFIPPLRGDGTLVITSARADRSSFGCGEQSTLTWFGHAFLVDALNKTADFQRAFDLARREIAGWEIRDGFEASEPQIAFGKAIHAQLARWHSGFTVGAPVAFEAPRTPAERGSDAVRTTAAKPRIH